MHLPAPTEGGNFDPVPPGTHLAVCTRVIDLGTQRSTYQGESKSAHKVMITWELPDEKMSDGRPFTISKRYTWSTHEKATLRKDLEAWRGAAFRNGDFGPGGFDIRNIIGKACILSVVHTVRDGKTYSNIASVGKPMKGVQAPEKSENPPVYLWIHPDVWDSATFNSLSNGLQDVIRQSPEYTDMTRRNYEPADNGYPEHGSMPDFHDDDIPF